MRPPLLASLLVALAVGVPTLARGDDPAAAVQLLEKFQCARCHDGLPGRAFLTDKHCVKCHQQILGGTFVAPPETLRRWQKNLHSINVAPSLGGSLLRREWLVAYLLTPYDLRPHLPATMPRLPITEAEARAIAELIVRVPPAEAQLKPGDPSRGRALFDKLACAGCHRFTGSAVDRAPPPSSPLAPAQILAPDLRHARDRLSGLAIVQWLLDPPSAKPGTLMPKLPLGEQDAMDLALFVLGTPLQPPSLPPLQRLPVLKRRVAWDEVNDKVFRRTCWHCHSQPDYALGDGGPGNTGGFGFAPRGLDLATATGASSGAFDEHGTRQSIFRPLGDGTPRLLGALLARHAEERGRINPEIRGMPLGLPALSPEQLQLVESWIAQGRPR